MTVQTGHQLLEIKLTLFGSVPPLLYCHYRWIEHLSPFLMQYEHISGSDDIIANALSRIPEFYHVDILVLRLESRMISEEVII